MQRRILAVALAGLTVLSTALGPPANAAEPSARVVVQPSARVVVQPSARVVVRATSVRRALAAVRSAGGRARTVLPIVTGVAADVPADRMGALSAVAGVLAVTPDERVRVSGDIDDRAAGPAPVVLDEVRGGGLREQGIDGTGVRVALVDTGVSPVADLAGRLVPVADPFDDSRTAPCVDLSGEGTCADRYGHGTFIAGLIAGGGGASGGRYAGVAPGADIVSIKIAGRDGSADVSKILAAIQWAIWSKDRYGIRVLNLSLGTDSPVSYLLDPLNYAVERAWDAGLVVVVAASNRGPAPGTISKPGDDPLVVTVGAVDDRGTPAIDDDTLPRFSGRGPTESDGLSKPDVVAPGARVVSLRAPGSTVEAVARGGVDATYRRGSGTSMATGVVSGVAALLLQARPGWTPDRVKYALMASARDVADRDPRAVGAGMVDAREALAAPAGLANQDVRRAARTGPLTGSRGRVRVVDVPCIPSHSDNPDCVLTGERTAQGRVWDPATWDGSSWYGSSWYGTSWYGSSWYGTSWYGTSWEGSSWYGVPDDTDYGTATQGSSWYGAWQ